VLDADRKRLATDEIDTSKFPDLRLRSIGL